MCGKKPGHTSDASSTLGSPPHVREEDGHDVRFGRGGGITPACAGRRELYVPSFVTVEDHPRMCGKKSSFSSFSKRFSGSPPHVREEASSISTSLISVGITPACAGRRGW